MVAALNSTRARLFTSAASFGTITLPAPQRLTLPAGGRTTQVKLVRIPPALRRNAKAIGERLHFKRRRRAGPVAVEDERNAKPASYPDVNRGG
jgi:hypothetical protein